MRRTRVYVAGAGGGKSRAGTESTGSRPGREEARETRAPSGTPSRSTCNRRGCCQHFMIFRHFLLHSLSNESMNDICLIA